MTKDTANILERSVDPGAHIECRKWCEKQNDTVDEEYMNVCIDICLQQKWRDPDSTTLKFNPL